MQTKWKRIVVIFVLVGAGSLSLAERAEDGTLKTTRVEVEPQAPQARGLANSGFISQQSMGEIFNTAILQRISIDERGEKTGSADAADRATASDDPDINLAGVERVRLRIWGMNDSSGEYGIEQGVISMPGIGRVSVAGRTSKSLEAYLSARLTAMTRREVVVSVEIARYQPFYATGLVARAGALDWRPGITLIQAVALAGGVLRGGGEVAPERSVVRDQTRSQLQFALAHYERLKAEKDGVTTVRPSARLRQLSETSPRSSRAMVSDFLARQNQLLEEQKASLNSQVASLEREKTAAQKEVEAAEVQTLVAAQQSVITRQLLDGLNQLKAHGNISNARYLAQQNDALTAEVRVAESRALVERARARVAAIERQVTILRQERRATLNDRIETLEREIAQHELTLAGSSGMRDAELGPAVEFNIARRTSTGMSTVAATLFTEIQPGDVVIISGAGERGAQTASAAPETGDSATTALHRAQRVIDASTVSALSGPDAARGANPGR